MTAKKTYLRDKMVLQLGLDRGLPEVLAADVLLLHQHGRVFHFVGGGQQGSAGSFWAGSFSGRGEHLAVGSFRFAAGGFVEQGHAVARLDVVLHTEQLPECVSHDFEAWGSFDGGEHLAADLGDNLVGALERGGIHATDAIEGRAQFVAGNEWHRVHIDARNPAEHVPPLRRHHVNTTIASFCRLKITNC